MPDPFEEGQPGLLQVARLPAGDEGVDRDDDRRVAGRLGAADEARGELVVVGPVELEPARPIAVRLGDLLQREGEAVLAIIGTPSAAAARAVASSPSAWTIFCTPIGASISGAGIAVPSTVVERSRSETSRSIRGTIRQRRKASRLAPHRVLAAGAGEDVVGGPRAPSPPRRARSSSATETGIAGFSPPSPRA